MIYEGLFLVIGELAGIEEDSKAYRAAFIPDMRLLGIDHADHLGVACHAVRGDRTLAARPQNRVLRGLGLDSHPDFPYRLELHDVPVDHQYDGENAVTTFRLPGGEVTTHWRITEDMKRRGISLPFVKSYAIEEYDDLDLVAALFERMEVVPT